MPQAVAAVIAAATAFFTTATGSAIIGTFIVKTLVAVAINAAISLVANAFAPKPDAALSLLDPAQFNNVNADPLSARFILYGESAIAGEAVYEHLHADREWVTRIVQLADFGQIGNPHDLVRVEIEGVVVSFDGAGNATGIYAGYLKCRFYGGDPNQTADAATITNSGGEWTSAHRGRSCVYAALEAKLSNSDRFPGGWPTIMFVMRGRRLYNPLLDSTAPGGSGAHRLDDESTWAYSNNAALVIFDYARGISVNGVRVAGTHIPADLIDMDWLRASIAAAAAEGWTINGFVPTDNDPAEILKSFAMHMAGRVASRKGKLAIVAGYDWPAILTLEADDLAGALSVTPFRGWRDAYNQTRASYRSELDDWGPVETNLIAGDDWLAEDGEELERPFAAPFATAHDKAARLAWVDLYRERTPSTIEAPWKLRAAEAGEADIVRVRLPQYDIDRAYEITGRALNVLGFVTLSLREWDASAALARTDFGTPPSQSVSDRNGITPDTPVDWGLTPTPVDSPTGTLPGIVIAGAPPEWVDGVVIEWRENGAADWQTLQDTRPETT